MRIVSLTCSPGQTRWILTLMASVIWLGSLGALSQGQEVRNAIRDYRDDRVFNYQASDPERRGKLFNVQTGHYGKYYNCDRQEDKRNSPYICWKPHHEFDFPPCLGFCENLRRDIAEIKQRISDGAGPCGSSCNCVQCRPNQPQRQTCQSQDQTPTLQPSCPCAQCAISDRLPANELVSSTKPSSKLVMPASPTVSSYDCPACKIKSDSNFASGKSDDSAASAHLPTARQSPNRTSTVVRGSSNRSYGLVSGKILSPTKLPARTVVPFR